MNPPRLLKETLILVVACLAVGLAANYFSPAGLSLLQPPAFLDSGASGRFPVVTAAEVKQLAQSSKTVLVDARAHWQYQEGHIPGAVSLPVYDLDAYLFPFLENHLPDTPLVVYCSNLDCRDSHLLAEELAAAGYSDIRLFAGGMKAWQEEGYTVAADH